MKIAWIVLCRLRTGMEANECLCLWLVLGQESIQRKPLRVEEFGDLDFFDVL